MFPLLFPYSALHHILSTSRLLIFTINFHSFSILGDFSLCLLISFINPLYIYSLPLIMFFSIYAYVLYILLTFLLLIFYFQVLILCLCLNFSFKFSFFLIYCFHTFISLVQFCIFYYKSHDIYLSFNA